MCLLGCFNGFCKKFHWNQHNVYGLTNSSISKIKPFYMLLWRFFMLLFILSSLIIQWIEWENSTSKYAIKHMKYFTNISYLCFFISVIIIYVFSMMRWCNMLYNNPDWTKHYGKNSCIKKSMISFVWIMWQCMAVNAVFIDIIYWTMLHNGNTSFTNLNIHLFNSIFVIIEFVFNRITFQPANIVFLLLYAASYMLFSFIYFEETRETIYYFLDWRKSITALYCVVILIVYVFIFLLFCLLDRIKKKYIYKRAFVDFGKFKIELNEMNNEDYSSSNDSIENLNNGDMFY